VASADLLRLPPLTDVAEVGAAISATTEATLDAALQVARAEHPDAPPVAVIAMGRLGGAEVGYGSDADVLFVTDDTDVAAATALVERLRTLLAAPSAADPPLQLDADLRPEGRKGPLVRSLGAYRSYYARWSSPWEAQALLRARFVAGDAGLGAAFERLADEVRYPAGGLPPSAVAEIRRVKGRVDAERLPRGADPATHTKLGRGGLSDIEWTVQLLQLQHGADVPALRTPRTLSAIEAARTAGLLAEQDAAALSGAWRLASAVRNAIMLVRDRPGDQLPGSGPLLTAVGRALGYPAGFVPGELVDDYRRSARHARRVVERVFYG
jgi:glutamate-ammonia-ligase adenylyltransferase